MVYTSYRSEIMGYATLAAAHILWQNFQTNKLPIYFDSLNWGADGRLESRTNHVRFSSLQQ